MLDAKFIRENAALVKKAASDKNFHKAPVDEFIKLDEQQRVLLQEVENLQARRNKISKEVASAAADQRPSLIAQVNSFKQELAQKSQELSELQTKLQQLLLLIPNPARADVPLGKDDSENVEIKKCGTTPVFDFKPLSHIELGEKHGGIDFTRGVKIAGSRSYLLAGNIARLEQAVLRYTYDKLVQ
nr:DUF3086 domain-containing protein [Oligoflexales bacterium]